MRILSKSWLLVLLFCWQGLVDAEELPPGWPWHGVNIGFPEGGPAVIERYRSKLGIDAVRLHMKLQKYAMLKHVTAEEAWNEGMKWAMSMLDSCAANGVKAILNISDFPLDPTTGLSQKDARFWQDSANLDDVVSIAEKLAMTFRGRGTELVAYDLMSEPVIVDHGVGRSPKEWPELLRRIVAAIRKNDSKRWIVVAPGPWGGPDGYSDFEPVADNRVIYGVHVYSPHAFTHQGIRQIPIGATYPGIVRFRKWDKERLQKTLSPLKEFQRKYDVPVLVGEFSAVRWAEGGEQYIKDLVAIFNEYGWSWLYFSATGWHGWNPDYNQNYPAMDKVNNGAWRQDFIGANSQRWDTLRTIFKVQGSNK